MTLTEIKAPCIELQLKHSYAGRMYVGEYFVAIDPDNVLDYETLINEHDDRPELIRGYKLIRQEYGDCDHNVQGTNKPYGFYQAVECFQQPDDTWKYYAVRYATALERSSYYSELHGDDE